MAFTQFRGTSSMDRFPLICEVKTFLQSAELLTERKSLLIQGAESRVFNGVFCGRRAVFKERFRKTYRLQQLDDHLTKERIKSEARSLFRCHSAGIPVPTLFEADLHGRQLVTSEIEGSTLKQTLFEAETQNKAGEIQDLLRKVGKVVAQLHRINVIHGDLTTSNMMVCDGKIVLIDFGLSSISERVEEKAVDIYVLERAFGSTHPGLESRFPLVLEAYSESLGKKSGPAVVSKYEEVKLRGRKRTMMG